MVNLGIKTFSFQNYLIPLPCSIVFLFDIGTYLQGLYIPNNNFKHLFDYNNIHNYTRNTIGI